MWVTVCGAAVCKSKCLYVNFIKSILLLYNLTGWIMLLFKSWLNIWWFKNILRSLKHKESNWASTYCQTLYQSVTLVLVWKQLGLNKIPEVIVLPFHIICHMCVIIIHIHPALWGMEINPSIKWDLGRRDNVSWQLSWAGQKLFQKWCSHSPSSPSCDYISWRCRLKQTALCNWSESSTSLWLSRDVTVTPLSKWSRQNTPKNRPLLKYSFMFVPCKDWRCSDSRFSLQVARVKSKRYLKSADVLSSWRLQMVCC